MSQRIWNAPSNVPLADEFEVEMATFDAKTGALLAHDYRPYFFDRGTTVTEVINTVEEWQQDKDRVMRSGMVNRVCGCRKRVK